MHATEPTRHHPHAGPQHLPISSHQRPAVDRADQDTVGSIDPELISGADIQDLAAIGNHRPAAGITGKDEQDAAVISHTSLLETRSPASFMMSAPMYATSHARTP